MSVHTLLTPTDRPLHRASLHLPPADRVHLLLALCCALTGTPWGAATAVMVLAVLVLRRHGRRVLARTAERPDAGDARRPAPNGAGRHGRTDRSGLCL